MSIILDALRKSEAARRRNEAPELFAAMPTATPPTRGGPAWAPWAVGGIGVASLAFALWLTLRTQTPPRADADAPPPIETPAQRDAAPSANGAPDSTRAADAPPNAAETTDAAAPPPAPNAMPPAPPARDAAPTTGTTGAATASTATPAAVAPPPRAPIATPLTPTPAPAATPAPDIAAPNTGPTPAVSRGAPLALADLDAGTRKQLPPLKLSMHVWHDAAAQRFVILDGQRLREGDVLGEVVVERITRDGATLSWRGTALKIAWR